MIVKCYLLDRIVVCKCLKEEYRSDTQYIARLRREYEIGKGLKHPRDMRDSGLAGKRFGALHSNGMGRW